MSSKLRDVSSSSSEAESDAESESPSKCQPVQQKQRRQRQGVKYQCPADFVYCDYSPCTSTRQNNLNDGNTELWLIKAPVNFNPDSLSGSRVPLMGLEALQPRAGTQQIYSVLSRPAAPTDLRLLTSDGGWPDDALRGPAFSGLINICESYGDCRGNQAPVAIPACPAPRVPEGLRQRFQPFGSRTLAAAGTKSAPEDPAGAGPPMPAKRVKPDPEEGEGEGEQKRKKKKKKKDKSVKEEREEEEVTETAMSSQSLAETPQEFTPEGGEAEEEKKKKKKKKKSKDRDGEAAEQCDTGAETSLTVKEEEEVEVKIEPVDPAYGDVEDSGKKKKKKKKREKVPSSD
ncbi:CD3e molecule, epsilon associated protein [Megalops cyprinoides]|uniref:CD3e molecule, epsilon associated protein n=1 Tax=Megalops cyprinoides TaxID=118141 RepID=UPI0018650615|nr:CD3e molecule, epsilon associated protein [Megalops cyprinoides]